MNEELYAKRREFLMETLHPKYVKVIADNDRYSWYDTDSSDVKVWGRTPEEFEIEA